MGGLKMRKIIIVAILISVLLVTLANPVLAAPPVYENWQCGSARGDLVKVGYHINTTNLQVDYFWIDNNSWDTIHLHVYDQGEVVFEMYSQPYSGYSQKDINGFKLRRKPATDPDDPDSVSLMPNTMISWGN